MRRVGAWTGRAAAAAAATVVAAFGGGSTAGSCWAACREPDTPRLAFGHANPPHAGRPGHSVSLSGPGAIAVGFPETSGGTAESTAVAAAWVQGIVHAAGSTRSAGSAGPAGSAGQTIPNFSDLEHIGDLVDDEGRIMLSAARLRSWSSAKEEYLFLDCVVVGNGALQLYRRRNDAWVVMDVLGHTIAAHMAIIK